MRSYFSVVACLCGFFSCATAYAATELDGTVRDQDGHALASAPLKLQNGAGEEVDEVQTDKDGHYSFQDVRDGSYVLLITHKDEILSSTSVVVTDSKPVHKDIDLTPESALNVIISHQETIRNTLSPKTGASSYQVDAQAIDNLPQGEDTSLDKLLLQTPGVAQDSAASGNLHIRGEHANVQYRLNGVLLPDGISGFGEAIDSHVIENATLLDGVLPAQYGFRTAAVVDINTKTGLENEGTASMMVGSQGTFQPTLTYGGTLGSGDYFLTISHLSSDLGIENPTSSANAIHDHTEQNRQFGYAAYMINPMQRVDLFAGNSISYYEIPNNPNQSTAGYQVNGVNTFNSANLNERQFESNQFAAAAWQGQADDLTMQISPYIKNSETHFRPDVLGDLLFNGVASDVKYTDLATGLQNDNSWRVNASHTLRAGFMVQNDHVEDDTNSLAFETDPSTGEARVDANNNNIVTAPILDNTERDSQLYGLYVQDEWKLSNTLLANYGVRFDQMVANVDANQLSPRLAFVYKPMSSTTLHAGYARYFTPPPQELVSNADISAFSQTTNAAEVMQNDPVKPESSHNFDVGVSQKLGDHWQVGLDGYYKIVHDMLDEGQFGSALILTPFNYEHGHIYGAEFTTSYTGERLRGYTNFAASRAMGENIVSAQFNFDKDELAYISDHYVHLDHDQTYTGSAGISYDVLQDTTVGFDGHVGSGLRKGFANLESLPAYATLDMTVEQKLHLIPHDMTAFRLGIINLFDTPYELRDGTGIGVGAPQWGARRGVFATLEQKF